MNYAKTILNNKWFWIILAIIIIILVVYFYGKKSATPPKPVYPKGGDDIPVSWSPTPLVEQLYNQMKGANVNRLSRDAAWIELSKLPTNDMVVAVYDVFNQLYYKSEGEGTLTQWIKDESVLGWTSVPKDAALNRLASLNLV